jgi:hypothetical protein
MKPFITILLCCICIQLFACKKRGEPVNSIPGTSTAGSRRLKITIGGNTYTATMYNNTTAAAFKEKLPVTINMAELNGNEKYFDLPYGLPADAANPGTIQAGDLMLFGPNTLVLFYKTFSTSYRYTRLARIDNPSRLTELGSGHYTVKLELE